MQEGSGSGPRSSCGSIRGGRRSKTPARRAAAKSSSDLQPRDLPRSGLSNRESGLPARQAVRLPPSRVAVHACAHRIAIGRGNRSMSGIAAMEFRRGPGGSVVALRGALDSQTLPPIWSGARAAVRKNGALSLRVDAAGVTYCDGSGIAFLLDLLREGTRQGARVT